MKLWLLTLAILSGSEAFPGSGFGFLSRVKRSQVDCAAIQTAHGECTSKAYADYQAEWAAGDDGRPDWVARKTCNYLTGSIENCGNKLVESGCVSQEEVDRMKDNQMAASLQQVKDNVQSWDSTKCPPVKSYLQRMGLLPTEAPVCERVKAVHTNCTAKAYEDYKTVFGQGEDGRPHWVARKTCNYLTEAIDVCGNGLLEGGCMDEEKLAKHKDEQIAKSLERVKSSVDYWDSSKCPPVKTYMQRIGLIPSDDETSSTSSAVGARFGGADRGDEGSEAGGEVEDSIDQGPWGLAAYAYYWWSGATGQTDRFSRSWSAFMDVWNSY
jgi:hypothetical protein